MDPMGSQDIAELLGVSRQRAHQLIARPDFPTPTATVNRRTKMWERSAVIAWANEHRYDIHEAPSR